MPREPIKRIQRNARPSDAYNDGSAVIPTGPERSVLCLIWVALVELQGRDPNIRDPLPML